MSMSCTTRVHSVHGGYRFEVRCDGKIVACGSRSTHALAETAAARERSVYESVHGQGHGGGGSKTKADLARLHRPSPTAHAADHKYECKRGHDGKRWCSMPDKNGVFHWKRV